MINNISIYYKYIKTTTWNVNNIFILIVKKHTQKYLNNMAVNLPDYLYWRHVFLSAGEKKNPESSVLLWYINKMCTGGIQFPHILLAGSDIWNVFSLKRLWLLMFLYSMWNLKWQGQYIYTIVQNESIKMSVLFIFKAHYCPSWSISHRALSFAYLIFNQEIHKTSK